MMTEVALITLAMVAVIAALLGVLVLIYRLLLWLDTNTDIEL
jgi:hypothetical protein